MGEVKRLSGVRSHVGLEKQLDLFQNLMGLSLQYLNLLLKESFRLLSGKHTEGKAGKVSRRKVLLH